jgi:hypothetical protein
MKVFLLCLLFLIQFSAWSSEAIIKSFVGQVKINGQIIKKNSIKINVGSVVEAIGKKSLVDIKFSNGHVIRIRNGKTIVKIMKEDKTLIELIKGSLFNVVNKLKKPNAFEVKTKHGSLGVRGTKFMVKADENETYLCVCEGIVRSKVAKHEFDVGANFDQFLRADKALEAPKKANSQMMTMATSEFELMGHPVN